jgi:hypothetical protein
VGATISASGKYRQNKTRKCTADPGKIREVCSPGVLGKKAPGVTGR